MISSNLEESQNSSIPTPQAETSQSDENQQRLQKLEELIVQCSAMTFEDSAIPTLAQKVLSNELEDLYYGLIGLRKALSNEKNPPIQAVINAGVVPRLVQLTFATGQRIQFEAAWCLTNVCSGTSEQTLYVLQYGTLTSFFFLLQSDNPDVIEQSIWGLGNIAGDSTQFRDLILQNNGVEAIVKTLAGVPNIKQKRHVAWALSNLCRGKPAPKFELISKAIPQFCALLPIETDFESLGNILWSLINLTEEGEGIKQVLSYNDVVPKLIELLSHSKRHIVAPALRIIGNILTGTDEQASIVLKEKNFIPELFKLAEHPKEKIRREVFWILSNITAGPPAMFEMIMGNSAYVEKIIHTAKNDEPEVKKEAIHVLVNSTSKCAAAQLTRILDHGVFNCLLDLLEQQDARFLVLALEGIDNCLKWADEFNIKDEDGVNKFVAKIEYLGAWERIEKLRTHENGDVYGRAYEIIAEYFSGDDDEEEEGQQK